MLPFRLPCSDDDFEGCRKGCEEKQVEDCVTLGAMFMPGGHAVDKATGAPVAPDPTRALEMYRAACEEGSARGCMRLADAHHQGMLADPAEETRLYRRACEAGANGGCVAAGRAFLDGRGVDVDAVQAADLFGRVCLRGNAPACVELGRLYESGEGVKADKDRAFQLFSKACKLGHDEGCLYASRTEEVLPPRN
ncbi:MAG: tetratricopeptide repeat protein [Polyangiaceae bacterium]